MSIGTTNLWYGQTYGTSKGFGAVYKPNLVFITTAHYRAVTFLLLRLSSF